jgi:hypothetical protein
MRVRVVHRAGQLFGSTQCTASTNSLPSSGSGPPPLGPLKMLAPGLPAPFDKGGTVSAGGSVVLLIGFERVGGCDWRPGWGVLEVGSGVERGLTAVGTVPLLRSSGGGVGTVPGRRKCARTWLV